MAMIVLGIDPGLASTGYGVVAACLVSRMAALNLPRNDIALAIFGSTLAVAGIVREIVAVHCFSMRLRTLEVRPSVRLWMYSSLPGFSAGCTAGGHPV